MRVTLLGTGSPIPDPERAGPATLVEAGGTVLLVDCGRGVLMRLAAAGVTAPQLSAVLVTHLHSDHLTDLNDLITTRWVMTFSPLPLEVVGPPRTCEVVDAVFASLRPDIEYRLAHHADLTWEPPVDVRELTEGVAWSNDDVRVIAAPTEHRPASPSVAYRVEHAGSAVVLAGDTVPCSGLDELSAGAAVLVHTVIRDDILLGLPFPRLHDVCDYHSSVAQAAQTARARVSAPSSSPIRSRPRAPVTTMSGAISPQLISVVRSWWVAIWFRSTCDRVRDRRSRLPAGGPVVRPDVRRPGARPSRSPVARRRVVVDLGLLPPGDDRGAPDEPADRRGDAGDDGCDRRPARASRCAARASWASLALAASAIVLAAAHTVPCAVRLGARTDTMEHQSRLARSILRDHLVCVVAIAFVLVIQLAFAR